MVKLVALKVSSRTQDIVRDVVVEEVTYVVSPSVEEKL